MCSKDGNFYLKTSDDSSYEVPLDSNSTDHEYFVLHDLISVEENKL